jgi:hypothetical protein
MTGVQELVRQAPEKHHGPPRLHPNGFVQLDLNAGGTVRLHVWPDTRLPQLPGAEIHDHVFDMMSHRLLGRLENVRYELVPASEGAYGVARARYANKNSSSLEVTGERGHLVEVERDDRAHYFLPAFELHSTHWSGLTATIIEQVKVHPGSPRVLFRGDAPVRTELARDAASREVLWRFIHRPLAQVV